MDECKALHAGQFDDHFVRRKMWSRVGYGLADDARHVIGCRLTPETRVQSALDDVACRAL